MKNLFNSFAFQIWAVFSILGLCISIPLGFYYSNINYDLLEEQAKSELEAMARASSLSIEVAIKSNNFEIVEETIDRVSKNQKYSFIAILEKDHDSGEYTLFKCFPDSLTQKRPYYDTTNYHLISSPLRSEIISGQIILGVSKIEDQKTLNALNRPIWELMTLAHITLIVVFLIFLVLVTIPIRKASRFAAELSKENYTSELRSTKGKNEISVLNNSLNTLKKNLMQHKETNDGLVNNLKKLVSKEKARTIALNDTAKLTQAQQLARMGSWELDIASNHMFFSKGVFDVLQVDQKKFIPSHDNYINLLHPDDRQITNDSFNNAIKDKKDYVLIQRRILDNGESIYLECRGQIDLGKDGEVRRVHGILIDISDKVIAQQVKEDFTKELEAKVLENTKQLLNLSNNLVAQDKLAMIGEISAGIAHDLNTPLGAIKSGVQGVTFCVNEFVSKIEIAPKKYVKDAIKFAGNRTVDLLVSGIQLIKEKEAFAAYFEQNTFPEHKSNINRIISLFVDIQTPLSDKATINRIMKYASPLIYLDLVKSVLIMNTFTFSIDESINRSVEVISTLKTYAREDNGLLKVKINLKENISSVLLVFGYRLTENVALEFDVDERIHIMGNEIKLFQLWSNLIKNALDCFGKTKNATVRITSKSEGDQINIIIANNGPEIPQNIQGKIFKKFFSTKQLESGSGLGLSIVKSVVDEHNGTIKLTSNKNETQFIVSFNKAN